MLMGIVKDLMIQEDEQGWSFTDKHVCAGCVDDYALEAAIRTAADPNESCDFCESRPAAELDVLLEAFVNGLRTEFGDADDEGVFYDGREGGYQWGLTWATWDLVGEFDSVLTGEGLIEAVREAMHDRTWVEVNFAHPRRDEALSASWERFCEAVQFETRYVFWLRRDAEDEEEARWTGEVPASRILDELGILITRLGLLRLLPAGYRLWRARTHGPGTVEWGASDLGTAPRERATQANRMNPAGIPMFYGAESPETAVREVAVRNQDEWVTVGAFETSRPCSVVDFSDLPPVPSMFDPSRGSERRPLLFLSNFAAQLAKPARMKYEQIDYVPTQVVNEYLLRIFSKDNPIVGLVYRSALTGDVSAVIDIPHDRCVDQQPGWKNDVSLRLGLVPGSVKSGPISPQ